MGSDESHFNVSSESDGQSHKTVSTNHNLSEEKGEPKRYRTEVLPLTSLTARPNRLTCTQNIGDIIIYTTVQGQQSAMRADRRFPSCVPSPAALALHASLFRHSIPRRRNVVKQCWEFAALSLSLSYNNTYLFNKYTLCLTSTETIWLIRDTEKWVEGGMEVGDEGDLLK